MATISSTMALNDAMSPALRSMASAVQSLTSAFEEMQRTLGVAVNTRGIDQATDALERTERQQDEVNEALREGSNAAGDLWGKIAGFVAAYAGWNLVQQTVAWSDELTNVQARLAQVDIAGDGVSVSMRDIYLNAQDAHASLQGMADIVARFGNNAKDAFSSNDELLAFSNQLYKMFSIAGTDQNGAAAAMLQLSQGLGAGVLRGEELNSVFEQAPIIIQTIADYLNVPIGQIRQMASEGKLTADVVKNAMLGAAEETNKKFAEMPLTFGAMWTMAKNTFQQNIMGLQRVISDVFNTAQFQQMMDGLTEAVSGFAMMAIPLVKGVAGAVGFLYRNWSLIAPVLFTVVGALTAYKAATLAVAAAELISKGAKVAMVIASYAKAAATGVEVSATTAATAAQWGLNTAMLACPLTWIVAAIIAVVGALYLGVAIFNKFAGTSISATGIIAGALWGFWGFVRNIIAYIWNGVLSLAEFFYNVWRNPVYSLKKLLFNLLENFLGLYKGILSGLDSVVSAMVKGFTWALNGVIKGINATIRAINHIPGVEISSVGELTFDGSVIESMVDSVDGMLSKLNPGEAPDNYKSLSKYKMDFVNPADYAQSGYDAGAKVGADPMGALKGALGLGLGEDPAIQNMMDQMKKQTGLQAETAKNTAPKEDESFKYIRDIMAGRAVDRLAGTEIKIQMNNNNNVNSAMDLDKMVDALAQKLTVAMDSAAEGVHY